MEGIDLRSADPAFSFLAGPSRSCAFIPACRDPGPFRNSGQGSLDFSGGSNVAFHPSPPLGWSADTSGCSWFSVPGALGVEVFPWKNGGAGFLFPPSFLRCGPDPLGRSQEFLNRVRVRQEGLVFVSRAGGLLFRSRLRNASLYRLSGPGFPDRFG